MTALLVKARNMHRGDIWNMHDWRLHVESVVVEDGNVVVVTEGPTMRHVPADELEWVDR
jgi:hypothetical protein